MSRASPLALVACILPLMALSTETLGANVLILGDSLSVVPGIGLGREVDRVLRAEGHRVSTVASCGSAPYAFRTDSPQYRTRCGFFRKGPDGSTLDLDYFTLRDGKASPPPAPKLSELTQDFAPDIAVIQQGTNLYSLKSREAIASQVSALLKELALRAPQARCLWVAPPEIARYNGVTITTEQKEMMAAAIREGIAASDVECDFLDSRQFTEPPGGDGTHHSKPSQTEAWRNAVLGRVRSNFGADGRPCNPGTSGPLPHGTTETIRGLQRSLSH